MKRVIILLFFIVLGVNGADSSSLNASDLESSNPAIKALEDQFIALAKQNVNTAYCNPACFNKDSCKFIITLVCDLGLTEETFKAMCVLKCKHENIIEKLIIYLLAYKKTPFSSVSAQKRTIRKLAFVSNIPLPEKF